MALGGPDHYCVRRGTAAACSSRGADCPDHVPGAGGGAITLGGPTQHFHVVVTNVSGNPIRVWREWCSGGYFTLSFQATDEAGKTTTVKKNNRGWDKNYPDGTTIPPGDHPVLEVLFDEATWQDPPLPEQGKSRTVRLRAIFEVPADQDTKASQVWTGRTLSPNPA